MLQNCRELCDCVSDNVGPVTALIPWLLGYNLFDAAKQYGFDHGSSKVFLIEVGVVLIPIFLYRLCEVYEVLLGAKANDMGNAPPCIFHLGEVSLRYNLFTRI